MTGGAPMVMTMMTRTVACAPHAAGYPNAAFAGLSTAAAPQNWKRAPSFSATGSSAAMTRSSSPTRSEKFVTAFELKRL